MYESAWDVPATSHVRMRLVFGCCAGGVAELRHVGLRLEHEHRDGQVGADAQIGGTSAAGACDGRPAQRSARAAPAVNEDPVEGLGQRLEGVSEGGQVERRLGLADGDDVLGMQAGEDGGVLRPGAAHGLPGRRCPGRTGHPGDGGCRSETALVRSARGWPLVLVIPVPPSTPSAWAETPT